MTDLLHLGQAYGAVDCANYALISLREHLMMLGRPDLSEKVRGIVAPLMAEVERELDKTTETRRKMQRR